MEDAVVKMDRTAVVPAKSKLTIDLANRISFGVETNKSSVAERRGFFHHLFRDFLYTDDDRVSGRPKLPSIVGGSNSFIEPVQPGSRRF
ncbi:hypothetical protein MTR67_021589 [Solanum verrucosum]|uniref:Uncharacterized protein n=1 Tax=Solanum verrucosum TaxID=315347 RepID=A0AAF0QYD1_SOLVR|nr:hypothetical protein MTR67_021589 [Solanum verrucosum]